MASRLKTVKPLPPTLSELRGEQPETERSVKQHLPFWAREVLCPICNSLMTPLRAKKDTQWGETITYQCQNEKPFVVMTLTTSVQNFMRPGDFDSSTFNWREVALQTPKMEEVDIQRKLFSGVPEIPYSPWTRKTNMSVLYETFWGMYSKDKTVNILALKDVAVSVKGDSSNLRELVKTLPEWMANRTGYAVKQSDSDYIIVGKTIGGNGDQALPYSDPEYKKVHGFEPDEDTSAS